MTPTPVPASDTPPSSVASAVYAAVRDRDWPRFTALVDPAAAEDFKREQHAFAAMTLHVAHAQAEEDESKGSSDADIDVDRSSLLRHVFKVRGLDQFDELPATELVVRFMRAKHRPRSETGDFGAEKVSIVGVALEEPDLAHVVVRTTLPFGNDGSEEASAFGFPLASLRSWVDVLTLRRTEAGWRCQLNGGLITSAGGGFSIGYNPSDDELFDASA